MTVSHFAATESGWHPHGHQGDVASSTLLGAATASHVAGMRHERLAWACYFLLGCGFLAPWNAFITAVDYFGAVYPDCHIDRLFTVCYLPPCLVSLVLFTAYSPPSSLHARILAGYVGFTLILVAVPLADAVVVAGASRGPPAALALLLLSLVALAILDGCCQPAVFGDVATLPPQYTHTDSMLQAVVGGTASAGVVISFLRIATKAALPATAAGLRSSTAIYFSLAAAISGLCVWVYGWLLPRLEVVVYWRSKRAGGSTGPGSTLELTPAPSWEGSPAAQHLSPEGSREEGQGLLQPLTPRRARLEAGADQQQHLVSRAHYHQDQHGSSHSDSSMPASARQQQQHIGEGPSSHHHAWPAAGPAAASVLQGSSPVHIQSPSKPSWGLGSSSSSSSIQGVWGAWRGVMRSSWRLGATVFLTCLVTLAIFPGFLSEDVKSPLLGDWYPVLLITLFNIADLLGKNLPFGRWHYSPQQLLTWAVVRLGFIPLFVAAALMSASAPIISLLTFALGLSNGFLTAVVMSMAPVGLPPAAAELTGSIMAMFLIGGLTAGAFAGWLWLLGLPS